MYIEPPQHPSMSPPPSSNRRNTRFSLLTLIGVVVTLVVILGVGAYFVVLPHFLPHPVSTATPVVSTPSGNTGTAPAVGTPNQQLVLPGQQLWKGGTSSLLFGSNDPTFNPATSQSLRTVLRQAGITLIRTPLTSDGGTQVEQRLAQIQAIGAECLGILSTNNMTLDQNVVKTAGDRCQMYEFGNEPDNPGNPEAVPASVYANSWNQIIPSLRQIAPQAKFFGPAVAFPDIEYISAFLQATQANAPDGVTFHMYPCTNIDAQTCLSQSVNNYASAAQKVRATVVQILGKTLPLGVTEWNDNWKDQATPEESDPNFMRQFTMLSLQSMAQGQIAFANQYNLGTGTGDGHLFLTAANGQAKPQLQAMADMIAQTRVGSSG